MCCSDATVWRTVVFIRTGNNPFSLATKQVMTLFETSAIKSWRASKQYWSDHCSLQVQEILIATLSTHEDMSALHVLSAFFPKKELLRSIAQRRLGWPLGDRPTRCRLPRKFEWLERWVRRISYKIWVGTTYIGKRFKIDYPWRIIQNISSFATFLY